MNIKLLSLSISILWHLLCGALGVGAWYFTDSIIVGIIVGVYFTTYISHD